MESEWWCERLALFIGIMATCPRYEQSIYSSYAVVTRMWMEISAALEAAEWRRS